MRCAVYFVYERRIEGEREREKEDACGQKERERALTICALYPQTLTHARRGTCDIYSGLK